MVLIKDEAQSWRNRPWDWNAIICAHFLTSTIYLSYSPRDKNQWWWGRSAIKSQKLRAYFHPFYINTLFVAQGDFDVSHSLSLMSFCITCISTASCFGECLLCCFTNCCHTRFKTWGMLYSHFLLQFLKQPSDAAKKLTLSFFCPWHGRYL